MQIPTDIRTVGTIYATGTRITIVERMVEQQVDSVLNVKMYQRRTLEEKD